MPGPFVPAYALPGLLGLCLVLAFPVARHMRAADRRRYYALQALTLLGAVVGSKLSVLAGDLGWPLVPLASYRQILTSGRSITGGLILGLLTAEAFKPLLGYRLPPNDRFACLLPFSIATGRLGCVLAGCCRGLPYDGPLAVVDDAGVARYPTQALELVFQLAAGTLLILLLRRALLPGRLFSLYLVLYGAFRFALEPIRDTVKVWRGLSVYQGLCLVMIALGTTFLAWRRPRTTPTPFMEALDVRS